VVVKMAAHNYATNGGFETEGTGGTATADGWAAQKSAPSPLTTGRTSSIAAGIKVGSWGWRLWQDADDAWSTGMYDSVYQSVDLTNVDKVVFSWSGRPGQSDTWTAELLIDGVQVWTPAWSGYPAVDSAVNQVVDVSAYSGTCEVRFKLAVSGDEGGPQRMGHLDLDSVRLERAYSPATSGPGDKFWCSHTNHAAGLTAAATAGAGPVGGATFGTANTDYPLAGLTDLNPAKQYREGTNGAHYLRFDLGSVKDVSLVALFNHTFAAGTTVTVEAHTSDTWATPEFTQAFTYRERDEFLRFETRRYRYWLIKWTDNTTAARLGQVWIGDHDEPEANIQTTWSEGWRYRAVVPKSGFGAGIPRRTGQKGWWLSGTFADLSEAERDEILTLIETAPAKPIVVVMDPTGSEAHMVWPERDHTEGHGVNGDADEGRSYSLPWVLAECGYGEA